MSNRVKIIVSVLAVVLVPFIFVYVYNHGPDTDIKRRLFNLVAEVEKSGNEGRLTSFSKAKTAAGFFAPDCRFRLAEWQKEVIGNDAVAALVLQYRSQVTKLSISLGSRQLTISSNGMSAIMEVRAHALLTYRDNSREKVSQDLFIDWINEDGEWFIANVSIPGKIETQ